MSDKPWNPEVERIRKAMMERFSDKLSMEEIADFAYSVAAECTAPAPQSNQFAEALADLLQSMEGFRQGALSPGKLRTAMQKANDLLQRRAATPQVTPTLKEIFKQYGAHHIRDCDALNKWTKLPCDCGFAALIEGTSEQAREFKPYMEDHEYYDHPDLLATIERIANHGSVDDYTVAGIRAELRDALHNLKREQASPTPELGTCQDHHATITPSTPHARTPYCCEWRVGEVERG